MVGFDLAHAIGNIPLYLHDWECDFACWCSYKYLNSGPGAIAGCFIHDKYSGINILQSGNNTNSTVTDNNIMTEDTHMIPRLAGWWGHRLEDRFLMASEFKPCHGAYGFRLSNPSVLLIACLRASLDLFDEVNLNLNCIH